MFFDKSKAMSYDELIISSKNLDEGKVSSLLKIDISYIRKKDDYSSTKIGVEISPIFYDGGVIDWTYHTQEKGTEDICEQLDELIAVFGKKVDEINKIKEMYSDLYCKSLCSLIQTP